MMSEAAMLKGNGGGNSNMKDEMVGILTEY